ncbi:MAG: dehydrogenase [Saprospiraceae bacterium]|nr:dehydrogenase [Saprospiraceae bacterium]
MKLTFPNKSYHGPIKLLGFAYLIFLLSCSEPLYDPSKSPEETVAGFLISPDFVVDVFGAEPYVTDPVDMIIDQKGRIYVVEMPDYPFKPEPGQGQGRIRQLFDDNQDGRIDRSTIFADHISEATSVHPWKDGLLVAAAPNISWMIDTDNDGTADSTEILFTGFFENNSEAQITNLKFMPDNWIYASNNGQGGEVKYSQDTSTKAISVAGGDFRFRLDQGKYELVSGPAQFGHAFNDRLHRFVTQNTLHMRHPVIPWKYLQRNPFIPVKNATLNISDHDLEMFQLTPPPYWRAERTRRRQQSYDEQGLGRMEYAEDHFTGASGSTFYGGHTFPPSYYGSIFMGDVAGNLIHRDLLVPLVGSPTYVAKRATPETTQEFLTSNDSWFRPVHFYVGPDGYLYVIDFYRQHIETPLSIPEDLKADMDFLEGSDRGRIYRIRPVKGSITSRFDDLSESTNDALIALLKHPNRWQRLQAQRLILERQATDLIAPLKQLFNSDQNELTRLHALFCLEGLGACDRDLINQAIQDPSPTLREQAILLAENLTDGQSLIIPLLNDPDIRVSFQACLSAGDFDGPPVKEGLKKMVLQHSQDAWFQLAILSSRNGSSFEFLADLTKHSSLFRAPDSLQAKFIHDMSYIIGLRQDPNELSEMQSFLSQPNPMDLTNQEMAFFGFLQGIKKSENKTALTPFLAKRLQELKAINSEKWKDFDW